MNKESYEKIKNYMISCMRDGAHDKDHVYRVLYYALDISESYVVDDDVILAAALLHDIGRKAQFENPELDHAAVGAEMAYDFLLQLDWTREKAEHVKQCISTHRYRKNREPASIEAKILFDADKLDVTGAVGIARTLAYIGITGEPLYSVDVNGKIRDGTTDTEPSFFHEYNFKLKNIYKGFYTERAKELAAERKEITQSYYEAMLKEVGEPYDKADELIQKLIGD
ncbi:MAG: HD domain-containing protein [Treponema sp.]|jgi:uncharacterized protein|nr:HD domain-containing protein [Treponema sp.]